MKKVVLLSLNLLWATFVAAQVVNIPDANFKKALVNNSLININGDTEIQVSEAVAYTEKIFVYDRGIVDLTGIEAFVNLTRLYCGKNPLSSLDLSKNVALIELSCFNNNLNTLDVSKNISLTELSCYNNNLSALNLSKNVALKRLSCFNNSLSSLDISKNIALTELSCFDNNLSTLNVSKNIALIYLDCSNNAINSLDVSKNIALIALGCFQNKLSNLNVSKNTLLTNLECSKNPLIYLNIKNGNNKKLNYFKVTNTPLLKCIQVDSPTAIGKDWQKDETTTYSLDCLKAQKK